MEINIYNCLIFITLIAAEISVIASTLQDTDIMWFRNPFPLFPANADITVAADLYTGNPTDMKNKANAGFNYVVSNTRTLQFYRYWYMSQHLYPRKNEQCVFDIIKRKKDVTKIGARIRYLDPAYFGGFCRRPSFNNVRTMHAKLLCWHS